MKTVLMSTKTAHQDQIKSPTYKYIVMNLNTINHVLSSITSLDSAQQASAAHIQSLDHAQQTSAAHIQSLDHAQQTSRSTYSII
jgi:hypothetical protein